MGRAYGVSADGGTVGVACGGCGIVDFTTLEGIVTDAAARGDTPNDDISDDANCDEDTWLELVELADIDILIREPCLQ